MAQLMPLPLTVSCFSKIQIGFTFLVPAHLSSPGQRAVKRVCVTGASTTRSVILRSRFHCVALHNVPGRLSYRLKAKYRGGSRGWLGWLVTPPGAAAYFMLLLCVWLKLISMSFCAPPRAKSFSHKPRPPQCSLASLARVSKSHPPSKKIPDPPMK